jgi:hypothetical protein
VVAIRDVGLKASHGFHGLGLGLELTLFVLFPAFT